MEKEKAMYSEKDIKGELVREKHNNMEQERMKFQSRPIDGELCVKCFGGALWCCARAKAVAKGNTDPF